MRTFVVGDIHGGLKALIQLLNTMEITEEDQLIFLGDYVDGWSESAQVIQFLMELENKFSCIFIKGNHDIWCENWLEDGTVNPSWYIHGGKATMESYADFSKEAKHEHLKFFKTMKSYYLDADNRLFIHAGFTSMHGVEKEVNTGTFFYDRTLWEMALALDENIKKDNPNYPNRLKHYNEIYIGHTPTIRYDSEMPMQAATIWNMDTGAAFTGRLSAMNIDTKAVYQSDPLPRLYPKEKGRN
ncbi:metallophosphoesterase family protein [Gaetbulibacter aestuarii]|uniref:Metallophosphoesterase family protein n=1 Tax=Gaetbulibacter aestuarii TaxID=1502358 RepID=A0ABW7MWQ3_9FLAO